MLALASSAGNFAGPLMAGLSIDAFGHRAAFGILAAAVIPAIAVLGSGRLALPLPHQSIDHGAPRRVLDLLAQRKLRRLYAINTFVAIGWDVHTVFVPIYGSGIGLSAGQIGLILSSFAAASFVVRLAIRWIARRWDERTILVCAFVSAAVTYLLLPFTRDTTSLVALSFVLGLGLGAGQPMVMSLLHAHAPRGRMGEAAGLRVTLIQSMAVAVPLLFGAVGSAFGMITVFWGAALCLGAGGASVRRRSRD
jgi:MFS family permease